LLIAVLIGAVTLITSRNVEATLTDQIGGSLEREAIVVRDLVRGFFTLRIGKMQALAEVDVLKQTLEMKNASYEGSQGEILTEIERLDNQWRTAGESDPLIDQVTTRDVSINPSASQLAAFLDAFPFYSEVFITDQYGATVAATGRLSDYYQADEGWWQASWNGGRGAVYISDPEFDESAGVTALLVAVPIVSDDTGRVIGILRSTLTVDELFSLIEHQTIGQSGHAFLLDESGLIIYDPRVTDNGGSAGLTDGLKAVLLDSLTGFLVAPDQAGDETIFGHAQVLNTEIAETASVLELQGAVGVNELGWAIVLRQQAQEAFAPVSQVAGNILATGLIGAVFAVGLGLLLARGISKPIVTLGTVADQIAAGQLDISVPAMPSREFNGLASILQSMAGRLRQTLVGLEDRVAARTEDLKLAVDVARRVASIRDEEKLLSEAVTTVRERFDLYHVQVYLATDSEQNLLLRAGSGDIGAELTRRGHTLPVGPGSINGLAAFDRQAVIVSDTADSANFLANPLLPLTRSEMAVPMVSADALIGVLNVQSAEPGSLSEENQAGFETLASQLAVAVENARLFAEASEARSRLEEQARRLTRTGWNEYFDSVEKRDRLGYAYADGHVEDLEGARAAAQHASSISTPIQVSDESIGAIHLDFKEGAADELAPAISAAVASQVGQKVEHLRLLALADRSRADADQAVRRLTRTGWKDYLSSISPSDPAYLYEAGEIQPLLAPKGLNGSSSPGLNGKSSPALQVPIIVRGEAIGGFEFAAPEGIDSEAMPLVNDVVERLSAHLESLRLYMETERRGLELEERSSELQASQRVTFAATETDDPAELLNLVVNLVRDQFDLYHVQVYLLDEEEQFAVLQESTGYAGRQLIRGGHKININEQALVTTAIHQGSPVLVQDVSLESKFLSNPLLPDTRSELVLPLKAGDRVLGAMDLQSIDEGYFSQQLIDLYRAMAEQIGLIIERSRSASTLAVALEHTEHQARQLAALNQLASQLGRAENAEHALKVAAAEVHQIVAADSLTIAWLSDEDSRLEVFALDSQEGPLRLDDSPSVHESAIAGIFRAGNQITHADLRHEVGWPELTGIPKSALRSAMSVPLQAGEKVLGTLSAGSQVSFAFSPDDGSMLGQIASLISSTIENRRLFTEIRETAERLREVDRVKSEFLANMSHELRTPLNSILGYSEVILMGIEGEIPDEIQEDVEAIHSNGKHLLHLINDVLDLARIEAGQLTLNVETVDLFSLIDQVHSNSLGLITSSAKPLELKTDIPAMLPFVEADQVRLSQILTNLISNAIKYSEKGNITIRAVEEDDFIRIEVEDQGLGIAPDEVERIFEKFTQVDESSTRQVEGTGLGLAITSYLVDMHGGTFDLRSVLDVGSTFIVRIPVKQPQSEPQVQDLPVALF
jgi:signal transduction histidine kinase/HAMP domain-containing protein